eukprot:CAMPEP_0197491730 /NCGR_PEP_ID=MMETSP1311-20131121/5907_1 /TAXON_ID=464262 /ORGANISM="Genus nov. species nov., Strain RCC856" /LENGTH=94 /DNA_ID=CAMNT_0043036433 /DNA_START=20 /DNA_END=301 /DNA_ORIENTATION=+
MAEVFELNVRQTSGGTFPVSVRGDMRVSELKQKLCDDCDQTRGIEPERQRLIYQGHVLKDEKTLESYNIKAGHTIHFVKGVAASSQQQQQQQQQ